MKFATKALITGFVFAAGVAFAADATDPTVKAWQVLMDNQGAATKILGEMAGEKTAFDAAAAEAAKATLMSTAASATAAFQTQAADPASKAKAEIWTNWDDFVKKADALTAAANALDATSVDGLKAGMGAIGGACKDCHSTFRS